MAGNKLQLLGINYADLVNPGTDDKSTTEPWRLNRNFRLIADELDRLASQTTAAAGAATTGGGGGGPGNTNDILIDLLLIANKNIPSPQIPNNGQILTIILRQDSAGGHTITWASAFQGAPTDLDTTPSTVSVFQFVGDSGKWVSCVVPSSGMDPADNVASGNTQLDLPHLLVDLQLVGPSMMIPGPTPVVTGQHLTMLLRQDSTGGITISWDVDFSGVPTEIDTTADTVTIFEFIGANGFWVMAGQYLTGVVAVGPAGDGSVLSTSAHNILLDQTLTVPTTTIVSPTVPTDGQRLTVVLRQDSTGGRLITWDTNFDPPVEIDTAPNSVSVFRFVGDDMRWVNSGQSVTGV